MKFYTNVTKYKNKMLVRGYQNGIPFSKEVNYKPYLFVTTNKNTEYRTLNGKGVEKLEFKSLSVAREFVKQYENVPNFEIYGMDKFVYPFIYDYFPGEIKYDPSVIRVFNLDIEVASDKGFPDVALANNPITLIGIGIGKERFIFGMGDYEVKSPHHHFMKCRDERHLLIEFALFWSKCYPDVITGWNLEQFDIPYIINRMKKILDQENDISPNILSPWRYIQEKIIEFHGKETQTYVISGISTLDYLDLYKKFTYNQLESYTLDHVAFVEVGRRKLDYSEYESLNDLYVKNYPKFVDYNITDIDRVADIDEKNKFLELIYAMAFDAKINFNDSLTSVLLWDVISHNYLMDRKIVIPPMKMKDYEELPGAYVKAPIIGMHDWVVSFDLTSLYPHLIMGYNISPETLVNKIPNMNAEYYLNNTTNQTKYTQAANGCQYRKDIRGFLPELMKLQFDKRVEYKNKMLESQSILEDIEKELIRRDKI